MSATIIPTTEPTFCPRIPEKTSGSENFTMPPLKYWYTPARLSTGMLRTA